MNKQKRKWRTMMDITKMKKYAHWLWQKTKPFSPALLLLVGIDLLSILIGFGGSFVSKNVVDMATKGQSFSTALFFMVLFTALPIIIHAVTSVFNTMLHERMAFSIRSRLFDSILSARFLALGTYHSGDLLTRLTSDADTVANSIASSIPNLLLIVVRLAAAFVLLYGFSPFLAIAALLLAPAGLIVTFASGKKMKAFSAEVRETEAAYRSFLQEHTAHMDVVKTFCQEEISHEKMCMLRCRNQAALLKRSKLGMITSTLVRCFFSLGYLISFGYCVWGLYNGNLTYGTMTLFLSLFAQIQQPIMSFSYLVPQAIAMLASAKRIMELEDMPKDETTGAETLPDEVTLTFRHASFAYDEKSVLKDISFTAQPHQLIGIMGPSGAGKTTLIRLVLALMPPSAGEIAFSYGGTEESLSASSRRLIAYVPQGNTLLSGTIRENLLWGNPNASEKEMCQALSDADADFVHQLPEGLDTRIGEKAFGLSEGQAQRIAIARAFLRRSPLLILDEATSALDEASEKHILTSLATKNRTETPLCLIITHRSSMLPYFDQVLQLEKDGSIRIA